MAGKTLVSQYDGTMVKVGDRYRTVNKGGALPEGADPEHVKVLQDRGMVAEGEPESGIVVPASTEPPFQPPKARHSSSAKSGS